jgi:hypothetical protein
MSKESTTPDLVALTRRLMEAGSRRDVDEGLSFFTADAVFDLSDLGFGVFEGAVAIGVFSKTGTGAMRSTSARWRRSCSSARGLS